MTDRSMLLKQHQALMTNWWITNLANTSALLFHNFSQVNWVGFYLFEQDKLILGPFQGQPACTEIAMGRGVCGSAAAKRASIIVPDVHAFPDHITCDSASRSEIVIPIIHQQKLLGVLDVDSPFLNRFDHYDQDFLEAIIDQILKRL